MYRAAVVVFKKPVLLACSTPGAAVLATASVAGGFNLAEAVGAFMISAFWGVMAGALALCVQQYGQRKQLP